MQTEAQLILNIIILFIFVAFTFLKYSRQRKMAERQLASGRDSLNSLLNTIDSILVSVDGEGFVTQWNIAAAKYTKIKEEENIKKLLKIEFDVIHRKLLIIVQIQWNHVTRGRI